MTRLELAALEALAQRLRRRSGEGAPGRGFREASAASAASAATSAASEASAASADQAASADSCDQAASAAQAASADTVDAASHAPDDLALDDLALDDAAPWGDREDVRGRGAFFTPPALARFVVEETLRPWAAQPPATLRVLDPACGDGRFLAVAAAWAARHLPATQLTLLGIERDARTLEVARAQLARLPAALAARCRVELVQGEALLGAAPPSPVDAVVGNPPYLRSIHLRARDPELWAALRQRFAATSHGEWDLYAPFIERALAWLVPGGRAGLVVPSRWLTAAFAAKLREVVASSVAAIVDFGALQLFEGATTYASVVVLERERAAAPAELVRLAAAGWVRDEEDLTARGAAPWILRAGPARHQLDARHGTLGEVAQIAKGCGTNADRIFIVRGVLRDGGAAADDCVFEGKNGDGMAVTLEAALLRRCLRGRDVPSEPAAPGDGAADYCLLPYRGLPPEPATAPPSLLPWDELCRLAPATAAYFASQRAALERRERGRFAGAAFYQLGRPQNLRFLLDEAPKVVIPDVAARGRAMLDRGSFVLDSAYAVRPHPRAAAPWHRPALLLALLRSPLVRLWLDMVGVPLRGGYFRMKTAFLAPMPLPPASAAELLAAAAEASEAGAAAEADELLRQAYAIDEETWAAAAASRS